MGSASQLQAERGQTLLHLLQIGDDGRPADAHLLRHMVHGLMAVALQEIEQQILLARLLVVQIDLAALLQPFVQIGAELLRPVNFQQIALAPDHTDPEAVLLPCLVQRAEHIADRPLGQAQLRRQLIHSYRGLAGI
ncbi:hypothetical protein D3C73_1228660 [compost metagenome]